MHHIPYPEETTLQESFLCCKCSFRSDSLLCKRLQEHKTGCLIIDSRIKKEE